MQKRGRTHEVEPDFGGAVALDALLDSGRRLGEPVGLGGFAQVNGAFLQAVQLI